MFVVLCDCSVVFLCGPPPSLTDVLGWGGLSLGGDQDTALGKPKEVFRLSPDGGCEEPLCPSLSLPSASWAALSDGTGRLYLLRTSQRGENSHLQWEVSTSTHTYAHAHAHTHTLTPARGRENSHLKWEVSTSAHVHVHMHIHACTHMYTHT